MVRVVSLLLLALAALLWRSLRRVRVLDPVFTPAPPVDDPRSLFAGPMPLRDIEHARPDWCGGPVMPHRTRWVGDALGGMLDG